MNLFDCISADKYFIRDDYLDWSGVDGFHCAVGSIDKRYAKRATPPNSEETEWAGVGWRGERLSAQFVLWADKEVSQIEFDFSSFQSAHGSIMDASCAHDLSVTY
ncbi:MAG: hypothetical protein PHG27_10980 [Massilibacteroides sp.]|nr:hypothetical protein [Massilibacteroides sp.]MDD3062710.1 hypothetical protein [Massilibacteroides sp.]MDD4116096.1 hypothetical protein [Massilibacteroides sp.]MDD4660203.1 hypothetical protein [Massilibacteroides sp.]